MQTRINALFYQINNCMAIETIEAIMQESVRNNDAHLVIQAKNPRDYRTPMQMAVDLHFWKGAEAIAKNQATDESDTAQYGYALRKALKHNELELVFLLLATGVRAAKAENSDDKGNTCLHIAIQKHSPITINSEEQKEAPDSYTTAIALLLSTDSFDFYLTQRNTTGQTALDVALQLNNLTVARMLVDHYKQKNIKPETLLLQALKFDALITAKWLLEEKIASPVWDVPGGDLFLHIAIRKNNSTMLQLLLTHGADLNSENHENLTPVRLAARLGFFDLVKIILEHIQKIGAADREKYQGVLVRAVHANRIDIVEWLLKQAVPTTAFLEDEYEDLCLHVAIRKHDMNMLKLLLAHKGDLNLQNKEKMNPLQLAAHVNFFDGVKVILEHIKSFTPAGIEQCKAISLKAIHAERNEVITLFLEEEKVFPINTFEDSLLMAVLNNQVETARLFFNAGLAIDGSDPLNGDRYVHIAVRHGYVEMLRMIQSFRPDLSIQNEREKMTALELAARRKSWECFALILNTTEINEHEKEKFTDFLFLAAEDKRFDIVDFLFLKGVSIDSIFYNSDHCLHIAVRQTDSHALDMLLSFNPDLNVKNTQEKMTPLLLAIRHGFIEGVEKILLKTDRLDEEHREKLAEFLVKAVSFRHIELVRLLLKHTVSTHFIYNGDSCLHTAIRSRHLEMLELLLQHGADSTIQNTEEKVTPVVLSGHLERWEELKTLLQRTKITPDDREQLKETLYKAVNTERMDMVELLVREGVPTDWKDPQTGEGLLHAAVRNAKTDIIQMLLSFNCDTKALNNRHETPEQYAIIVWHFSGQLTACFRNHRTIQRDKNIETMDVLTTFAQDRRQDKSFSFFARTRVPDSILLNILRLLGGEMPPHGEKMIAREVERLAEIKKRSITRVTIRAMNLASDFTFSFRRHQSGLFFRCTNDSKTFVTILENALKDTHCTLETIGNIVNIFVKTKENDPKKDKSDTWKLLQSSGLLKFLPKEDIEESKTPHVVSREGAVAESKEPHVVPPARDRVSPLSPAPRFRW